MNYCLQVETLNLGSGKQHGLPKDASSLECRQTSIALEKGGNSRCPCCSGRNYSDCCKTFHEGKVAPTPLALMRSRYSAYALGLADYIQKTTHPNSPHLGSKESIEHFCKSTKFLKLEIVSFGDNWVHFIATLEQNNKPVVLNEKSRFEQINAHWLYVDGEFTN